MNTGFDFIDGPARAKAARNDTWLICVNGHVINPCSTVYPDANTDFCTECGAKAISKCPDCRAEIKGDNERPNFCGKCGKPYPWIAARISAINELAAMSDDLSESDREQLAQSVDDIAKGTPRVEVASEKFKRILKKAGKSTADAMRTIIVDVASEAAKKSLGL